MNGKAIAFKLSQFLMSPANNASHSRVKLAYSPLSYRIHLYIFLLKLAAVHRRMKGKTIGEL